MSAAGREDLGYFVLNYRGELLADELRSTSLTFGHFNTRTQTKFSLVPEKSWALGDGAHFVVQAGGSLDSSNHDGSAFAPIVSIAREQATAQGYTKAIQLGTRGGIRESADGDRDGAETLAEAQGGVRSPADTDTRKRPAGDRAGRRFICVRPAGSPAGR